MTVQEQALKRIIAGGKIAAIVAPTGDVVVEGTIAPAVGKKGI